MRRHHLVPLLSLSLVTLLATGCAATSEDDAAEQSGAMGTASGTSAPRASSTGMPVRTWLGTYESRAGATISLERLDTEYLKVTLRRSATDGAPMVFVTPREPALPDAAMMPSTIEAATYLSNVVLDLRADRSLSASWSFQPTTDHGFPRPGTQVEQGSAVFTAQR